MVRGGLRGPDFAAGIWQATVSFAAAAQLTLHPDKSGVFSGCGLARQQLQVLLPHVKPLVSFKDLGFEQLAGQAGQGTLLKRIQATADRFDRLGGLPLPHLMRLRAASGVQAAVYGAVAGRPKAAVLAQLRTKAGRAVWRGGGFGAIELRLLLGCPFMQGGPGCGLCKCTDFCINQSTAPRLGDGWRGGFTVGNASRRPTLTHSVLRFTRSGSGATFCGGKSNPLQSTQGGFGSPSTRALLTRSGGFVPVGELLPPRLWPLDVRDSGKHSWASIGRRPKLRCLGLG